MRISDWSSDVCSSDLEKELLQVASVPLYKILTVQAAYGRGMATDDHDTLAEIASIDLLYAILERITAEAGRSMASFLAADEAKLRSEERTHGKACFSMCISRLLLAYY